MLSIRAFIAVCAAGAACTALAGDPDIKEILRKADSASKALRGVTYKVAYFGEGDVKDKLPRITGEIRLEKIEKADVPRIHSVGEATTPGGETTRFHVATDGKSVVSIDVAKKTYARAELPAGRELLSGPGTMIIMHEFAHETPFEDEINARATKYEGTKSIGGVDCHVIYVTYEEGSESRWYFAKIDGLPRRVERIMNDDGMKGAFVLELSELDPQPKFAADAFSPKPPAEFTEEKFEPTPDNAPALLAVGAQAPSWTLKTQDGQTVSLESLKGKIVVLDFWATWCGPCKKAMPSVQALHEKFKDKPVAIFGLNTWERPSGDPVGYMKSKNFTYGLLLGADEVAKQYNVSGIPTFYVIGRDGKIIYATAGFEPSEEKKLVEVIETALKTRE